MVAIVSGNSLGLGLTSWATLGERGQFGTASLGQAGEQSFVNVATGNLVLQDRDDVLAAPGIQVDALRTYNSLGLLDDDNGDNWSTGAFQKNGNLQLTGTPNTAGSTVTRTARDGAQATYLWSAAGQNYLGTAGDGAHDTIAYDSASQTFTWTDGSSGATEQYRKLATGKYALVRSADAAGNATTYSYDGAGLLTRVQAASGDAFNYRYVSGNLASVSYVSAAGNTGTVVGYGYDNKGRLASVTVDLTPGDNSTADGKVYTTTYSYDSGGRLASTTQADGTKLSFNHQRGSDGVYRVTSVTDGLGKVTTYSYDLANRRTTVTDPLGRATVYAYDTSGQLTSVTAPAIGGVSQLTTFAYSANGDLVAVTDPLGQQLAMGYDASGNQTLQRDAAGNTITRTFNANNQLVTEALYVVADPDGAGAASASQPLVTRHVYDGSAKNLLRFVLSPEGRVTEYRHDALGQRVAALQYTVDAYGAGGLAPTDVPALADMVGWTGTRGQQAARTDFNYDYRGRLQTATQWAQVDATGAGVNDGKQSVTTYVRDAGGRLLQTVSPNGSGTTFTYDGLGRVLTETNALSETTLHGYDAASNTISVTQANGLVTTSAYDKNGRLVSVAQSTATAPNLGTSQYAYDANNKLLMTQDSTGVRHWMLYDEAGRQVADIDGNGSLTEYVYNADNLLTRTIAYATAVSTGSLADNTGTPLNPTLASIRPAANAADRSSWRIYDAADRLVKTVDARGGVVQTVYDGLSRVVSTLAYAARIATASLGNAPASAAAAPVTSADDRTSRNFHDGDGLLRGTLDGEGFLTENLYDAAGRLVRTVRYANPTDAALRGGGTLAQLLPASSDGDTTTTLLSNNKGQVTGIVDAEGYLTEKVYDADGNLARTVRYAGKVTAACGPGSSVADVRPAPSPQDQSTRWSYDALGRVAQQTDVQGTVTQFSYDKAGNLVKTVAALGQPDTRTLLARYDVQGRMTGELTAEGALQLTGNQTQAQVDTVWSQWGLTHSYDAAGRRTGTTDQYGNRTLFFYNADGQRTHTVNALGEVVENQYHVFGQTSAVVKYGSRIGLTGLAGGLVTSALTTALNAVKSAALDSTTSYAYLATGSLASVTDAMGFATTSTYNAFDEEDSRTQALGSNRLRVETTVYDRRGLLLTRTQDPGGIDAASQIHYDAFGRIWRTTDANGNTRNFDWDRLGRQVGSTDATGAARFTTYDAFDRVLTQKDALGNTTSYLYDPAQRSIAITTPEGIATTTVFTRFGQTQSVTDGRGNTTSFLYDRNGNLKTTTRADGTTTSANYDRTGRIADSTDANGDKVSLSYDAASRVITRMVDPGGLNLVTSYAWTPKGQQLTVTDPDQAVTQFSYDANGQLARQVVDPGGLNLTTQYTYDGAAKVLTVTSPTGTVTQYGYDLLGRRTKEQVDPTGLNLTRSWTYDKAGNAVTATDANGQVTRYVYDAENRQVYAIDPLGDVQRTVYGANGRVLKTTAYATPLTATALASLGSTPTVGQVAPLVTSSPQDSVQHRVYDRDGRLAFTVDGAGSVVAYAYDGNGNVVDRLAYAEALPGWTPGTTPSPVRDAARDLRLRTVYDKLDRAIYTVDGAGGVVAMQYDAAGRLTERKAYAGAIPAGTAATASAVAQAAGLVADAARDMLLRQVYDKAGRLTWSVDGAGAVTRRSYDGAGNLRQLQQYAGALAAGADPSTVASSAANRTTTMSYDKAGRCVETVDALGGVVRNVYDNEGRLTQSTAYADPALANDAANRVSRFAYDTAGRLAYAIDATGAITGTLYDGAGNAVKTTAFAGPLGAAALAGLSPTATAATVAGLVSRNSALDRVTQRAFDAAGQLVYTVDAAGYVRETQYDGVGRTRKTILHDDPAMRTESYAYDAAGRLLASTDALGFTETFSYNAIGDKLSFTNRNGATWSYDHDAAGRLVQETSPEVQCTTVGPPTSIVTRLAYDALGNLTARTEAAGTVDQRVTSYQYDPLGRQVKTLYPAVAVYNAAGDPLTTTGLAARSETPPQMLSTSTFYDALGNAVAGIDLAGNWSYKSYDRLGRVAYEMDAMGYMVGYTRNTFGEVTDLARYATAATLPAPSPLGIGEAQARAIATALAGAADRHLLTQYDRRGQTAVVTEPSVYNWNVDAEGNGSATIGGKVTTRSYNAFGELVRSVSAGATTDHVFDARGLEVATIDAMGFLSTQSYDAAGQLLSRTEYAVSIGGGDWGSQAVPTGIPNAIASAGDRTIQYTYDDAGRKTAETRKNVEVSTNGVPIARADGTLSVTRMPRQPTAAVTTPAGSTRVPSVAFFGGADGSGVLQWRAPPAGTQASVKWRLAGTQEWSSGDTAITTGANGLQSLAIAADMPSGTYEVEIDYLSGDGIVALETLRVTFPGPALQLGLVGAAPTSALPGIGGVVLAMRNGVDVLQWPLPSGGATATLHFIAPGSTDWLPAQVQTDSAAGVQYVAIPDGLPAGSYALQLDLTGYATQRRDVATTFAYDHVGNLVRTTDALQGDTYSYYDALGRVLATATPAVAGLNGSIAPLTEYFRDAYGNVVGTIARANGAAALSDTAYTRGNDSADDRVQGSAYDGFGHLTQTTDANGASHYFSYNARGDLAKSWQAVSDATGTCTVYQRILYDKLGRAVSISEPAAASLGSTTGNGASTTVVTYNAFGEVTDRKVDGMQAEFFRYDNAGRVWMTNSGDGVDCVMLHDTLGRATLELRSDGSGGSNIDVAAFATPDQAAAAASSLRKTISVYDKLGHLVKQVLPQRLDWPSGVNVTHQTVHAQIVQVGQVSGSTGQVAWTQPNRVTLLWTSLAALGSGEIKVELSYTTDQTLDTATRTVTRYFTAEQAASGVTLQWSEDSNTVGGIGQVTGVSVYKKDVFGQWQKVTDQAALADGTSYITVLAPTDASASVQLQGRVLGGGGEWATLQTLNFGDQLFYNTAPHGWATYEYRVLTQRVGEAGPTVSSSGSIELSPAIHALIATPVTHQNIWGPGRYGWQSPGSGVVQTLRYRAAGSTGSWQTLAVGALGGGYDGINALALLPGSYDYELLYSHAGDLGPYAYTTGQLTLDNAIGTPPVPGFTFQGKADGSSVIAWTPPPAGTSSRLRYGLTGASLATSMPGPFERDASGREYAVTPSNLQPGTWWVEVAYLSPVDASVVNISLGNVTIKQGPVEQATCLDTTPVYTGQNGFPPLDGWIFTPASTGAWSLSWPLPPAGGRSEIVFRKHGATTWITPNPADFPIVTSGSRQQMSVSAATLPPGNWDIALRQFNSGGTQVYQNDYALATYPDVQVVPTLADTTPAYTAPVNVPLINTTFTANTDGSWSLAWPRSTDSTVSLTLVRYRLTGSTDWSPLAPSWQPVTRIDSGTTQRIDFAPTTLAAGSYDVAVFDLSGTKLVAQRLCTVTVKPPTYAAAAQTDTTPTYVPGYSWSMPRTYQSVSGILWSTNAQGSTLFWQKAPSGYTTVVSYRRSGTGTWTTADPNAYAGTSPQSLYIGAQALTDGAWDVQVTQVSTSGGTVLGVSTATINVSNGGVTHDMRGTWPAVRGFAFTNNLSTGGSVVSWSAPDSGFTAKVAYSTDGVNWTPMSPDVPGGTQVTIGAATGAGTYYLMVEMVGSNGQRAQATTGTVTIPGGGFGNGFSNTTGAVPAVTTSAPGANHPKINASFASSAADGSWSLTWPLQSGTMNLYYKVAGSTGGWQNFSSKISSSGSTQKASIAAADLPPGSYEFDLFCTSGGVRTSQSLCTVTVSSTPATKAAWAEKTPPYTAPVNAEPIPVTFTLLADGNWRMAWPVPTFGTTLVANWQVPNSTAWIDQRTNVVTSADGLTQSLDISGTLDVGTYRMDLAYAKSDGTRTAQYKASVTFPENSVPPTLAQVDSGYRKAENLPVILTQFIGDPVDGSWTLSWNHPPAGKTATLKYQLLGSTAWLDLPQPVKAAAGRDAVQIHTWDLLPGQYQLDLFFTDATGRTDQAQGLLTMHVPAPDAPVMATQSTGYVPATFGVTQATTPLQRNAIAQLSSANTALPNQRAVVNRSYDRWGNLLTVSDARSTAWITSFQYNANNQLVRQTQTDGDAAHAAVTTPLYDALGRQLAVTDANGNTSRQEWDAAGNLVQEIHADGGTVRHSYSVFGGKVQTVTQVDKAASTTTTYSYDKLSHLLTTRYAAVHSVHVDAAYNLVDDGTRQLEESSTWDQAGRKISHTGTDGTVSTYRYDLRGNVIKSTSSSVTMLMAYDTQGRLVAQQDGNGLGTTWWYDYFGKLSLHTDIGGRQSTYSYDNARQLIAQSNDRLSDPLNPQSHNAITYRYDKAGNQVEINDASTNTVHTFSYDLAGHRIRETTKQGDVINNVAQYVTYQDNHLAYDALGRLRWVGDGRAYVSMHYDKVGNRTRITTHVITESSSATANTQQATVHDTDYSFQYDAMNRQTLANGTAGGTLGTDGHRITYDFLGNKTSDSWQGTVVSTTPPTTYTSTDFETGSTSSYTTPPSYVAQLGVTTETYDYDTRGRLAAITRDGTRVDDRLYDAGGRLVQTGALQPLPAAYVNALYGVNSSNEVLSGNGSEIKFSRYDADGRLLKQLVKDKIGTPRYELDYANAAGTANHDGAGNLLGYKLKTLQGSSYTNQYTYSYARMDGYREQGVTGQRVGSSVISSTRETYDGNGFLTSVADTGQQDNYRSFVNDEAGRALYVKQGSHVQRQLIVNGEVLGRYGGTVDPNQARSVSGVPMFKDTAEFNFGFAPTGGDTPQMQDSTHVVSAGDTLQAIAQAAYGDSRLWYRVADANGLSSNEELRAGQVLKLPPLQTAGNAAGTFKPYDPSAVKGDTAPFLPAPQPKKKGWFGKLLAIVIMVIVTIYTAGALSGATGGLLATLEGGMTALGSAVTGAGLAGTAAGTLGVSGFAVSAAAGSIAGQAFSIASGQQDGFSWKQVALSALSAGVGAGLPAGLGGAPGSFGNAVARAAVGNAITQGIGVVTGLQGKFDWRGVATSAVGAGVGQVAGDALHAGNAFAGLGRFGQQLAQGTVRGFASGLATAVARGGRVAVQQVAVDAFGNALGNAVAAAGLPDAANHPLDDNQREALKMGFGPLNPNAAAQMALLSRIDLRSNFVAGSGPDQFEPIETALPEDGAPSNAAMSLEQLRRQEIDYRNRTEQIAEQVQDADFRKRGPKATAADVARYEEVLQQMPGWRVNKIFHANDPNHFVIGAFLDGTWNKRPGEDLLDTRPGVDYTNAGLLELMSRRQNSNFRTKYFEGVGTDWYTKLIGGATGAGVTLRAEGAYEWMVKQVNAVFINNSHATFDLLGVGFSRGSLETRMLLRMLDQRGIPDTRSAYDVQVGDGHTEVHYERDIVAPGTANLNTIIFDTVTTGVGDFYNVDLPTRAQVYHPIARDEMRPEFASAPLARLGQAMSSNWFQPVLPGDHSDLGNNHDRGGLGDLNLKLAYRFMTEKLGLPMAPIPSAYTPRPENMWIHDMRGNQGVAPPDNSPFVRAVAPRYTPLQSIRNPY
ncbi:MAG: DUF2235 domain-containing protein [Pseudomonadota bacterium]